MEIDEDAGVIKNIKLLGRRSPNRPNRHGRPMPGVTNGTFYSDQAFDSAIEVFEGAKVRLNHPSRQAPNEDRDVADDFAVVRDIHRGQDGVYGDLHYNRAHPFAARLVEDVRRKLGQWGMSPNALGVGHVERGTYVVDELAHCRSIDLVSDPATTVNLWESKESFVANTITVTELFERVLPKVRGKRRIALVNFMEGSCMKGKPGSVMEADDPMGGGDMGGGGDMAEGGMGDTPVAEPAPDTDHDEMLRSGFEGVCMKVIQDALGGKMDPKAALGRLKELINAHHGLANGGSLSGGGGGGGGGDEITADTGGEKSEESKEKEEDTKVGDAMESAGTTPSPKPSGPAAKAKDVKDSKQSTTTTAESRNLDEAERRELLRYRKQKDVVSLCESLGYEADQIEVEAMCELTESNRRSFILKQKKFKNRPRTTIPSREDGAGDTTRREKPMAEGATALAEVIKR